MAFMQKKYSLKFATCQLKIITEPPKETNQFKSTLDIFLVKAIPTHIKRILWTTIKKNALTDGNWQELKFFSNQKT